jgi:hypothetical protein
VVGLLALLVWLQSLCFFVALVVIAIPSHQADPICDFYTLINLLLVVLADRMLLNELYFVPLKLHC